MGTSIKVASLLLVSTAGLLAQDRPIRMPLEPRILPDGRAVVFAWQSDIWIAPLDGTAVARRLTTHVGEDGSPIPSPDGKHVLFSSDRAGGEQLFLMPIDGGEARQLTFDGLSRTALGFSADGRSLLVLRSTDRSPFGAEARRLFARPLPADRTAPGRVPSDRIVSATSEPERMLVDFAVGEAALSPDGKRLLATRLGVEPWRKGYRGSAASQLWLIELGNSPAEAKATRLSADRPAYQNIAERAPLWSPDGSGYWFVSDPDGTAELFWRATTGGEARAITRLGADGSDDGVLFPSASADGKRILFQRRFDLALLDVASGVVRAIDLRASGDALGETVERRRVGTADNVAFTDDGKQFAFVAGHDVFVMDRVLKEPVQVTDTPAIEGDLAFTKDGKRLFFVSEHGGEVDLWEASCSRDDGIWWRAAPLSFALRKVTDDAAVEARLALSPTGAHVAYAKGGDLFVMDADGTDHRRIVAGWDAPVFDWSPDGTWLCYSREDDDFNDDVWIVPLDGTRPPFNLSRHPDDDSRPVWSGDGQRIAWVGRRDGEESDIWYVTLAKQAAEETDRDRRLEKAIEAMKKGKGPRSGEGRSADAKPDQDPPSDAKPESKPGEKPGEKTKDVVIDFDGIHERIARLANPDSGESGLLWSPDGKKLAFNTRVGAESGFFTVTFPDELTPKKLASSGLADARWLKEGDQIVGRGSAASAIPAAGPGPGPRGGGFGRGGGGGSAPASLDAKSGKLETFGFTILEERDWREIRKLAFDQGWRAMRDRFYDGNLNNRDWAAIRAKYRDVAAQLLGRAEFSRLMNHMLGELNASHMGHSGGSDPLPRAREDGAWTEQTYHAGLRFDDAAAGPGLLVSSVIPGSPAAQARSLIRAGERVLAVDGRAVAHATAFHVALTMREARDVELTVRGGEGAERKVVLRPVTSVAGLLYDEWIEDTRRKVEELSGGRLGYLHIRGMDMSSFLRFEEDLYHAGAGKDGLIVDVRWNGGGSTADHVLTALTQPRHAIAVPRGGGPGYPQDRKVYATWFKPVAVMCNERSFSNAEILSHAVKTLGRGPVVGMRTAGGVISTGGAGLLDGSMVRMPFRGWYLVGDGADMELNGCMPDVALWNTPGGPDAQLAEAVKALLASIESAPKDREPVPASTLRAR
ncbi:MAG: PD40 domain-containing protein [Planctomycetes bacterium]|nr:PD40 domain-containing protein [Planctomycetota bacterium]